MCGIAGIFNADGGTPPRRSEVEAMIARIRHRGPDATGIYEHADVVLGHARLSIIDIVGGAQPMTNEDHSVWVTFNGEIFNYIELRRHLKKRGHVFSTRSDTEVIVHLYEEYGLEFAGHLNGQFAMAIWDSRRRQLVLVRDGVGIRPLFYTEHRGRLYFASEIKALFACPEVPRSIDTQAMAEIFTYWSTLGQRTAFSTVKALPPGHLMVFDVRGNQRRHCYWDWRFPPDGASDGRGLTECLAGLDSVLARSVHRQTRADVPVGAYVSGGLDSAMILSYLTQMVERPPQTFSLRFQSEEFDEGRYQKAVVDHFGTQHTEVVIGPGDIGRHFPAAVWHAETPILRTAPVPMMLLARAVRDQGIKVVLTGEGADETLAGYDLFREARIRRFWARDCQSRMRPALLARLYPYLKASPATTGAYAARFFGQDLGRAAEPGFGHWPRWQTTRRMLNYLNPDLRGTLSNDFREQPAVLLPREYAGWHTLSQDQYLEAHTLLSGYLLSSQGDRMALAHGVETRVPFLDPRVIEFANNLPPRYKLMGLKEKFILKALGRTRVPALICDRSKQPFRAPDSHSFFHNGLPLEHVAHVFNKKRLLEVGYFDAESVCKLFEKCRHGRAIGFADNMAFVGIYSAMLIYEQFIENDAARPYSYGAVVDAKAS
ncbi:MAG: asparagine synthase (glutamine-hydrolyzing) [Acidiferrobacter sp.]